ncbi:hypothetical protein Tco_0134314 [Tanacetum coccineum]
MMPIEYQKRRWSDAVEEGDTYYSCLLLSNQKITGSKLDGFVEFLFAVLMSLIMVMIRELGNSNLLLICKTDDISTNALEPPFIDLTKQDQPEPSHVQESACDSSSLDLKRFDNTLPLTERQLIKYLRKVSRVLFNRIAKKQWEHHEEAVVSYADIKASIDQYYDENIAHRDQTDKLVEASMSSLDRSNTTISDLYKGMDVITKLLKDINNVVKDDPAANQKINEATDTFARISSNVTKSWLLGPSPLPTWHGLLVPESQALRELKIILNQACPLFRKIPMMAEMYAAFKGQPSSAHSGSVTLTLALTHIPANVEGENATSTATEEPPSHTEGENGDTTMAIPISSI